MALIFTLNIQTRENYSYQPTKGGCKNENLAKQLWNKSAHVNTQMCTIVWKEHFSSLSIHVLNLLQVQTVARNLHRLIVPKKIRAKRIKLWGMQPSLLQFPSEILKQMGEAKRRSTFYWTIFFLVQNYTQANGHPILSNMMGCYSANIYNINVINVTPE